jgi:5-formyltetrahydrofolate cyclo-ligase
MLTKPEARQHIKTLWPGLDWPTLSAEAGQHLPALVKHAANYLAVPVSRLNVLAYHALPGELNLTSALSGLDLAPQQLWLPRVLNRDLLAGRWSTSRVIPGAYGIAEPVDDLTDQWHTLMPLLLLVPSLAVNSQGYRLGRGKGYYDRLLAKLPSTGWLAIGVCPTASQAIHWPPDPWDTSLHGVLSETGFGLFTP